MEKGRRIWRTRPVLSPRLAAHAEGFIVADAWNTRIAAGETTDPARWAQAVLAASPLFSVLAFVKEFCLRPLGLAPSQRCRQSFVGFVVIDRGPGEIVLLYNDKHLDFLVGFVTTADRITCTTLVKADDGLGRLIWQLSHPFHPHMIRAAIRWAKVPTE